jgi:hypothetical protein
MKLLVVIPARANGEEILTTVQRAKDFASNPQDLSFAVAWFGQKIVADALRRIGCRVVEHEEDGANPARALALQLWRAEDRLLYCDSHTAFGRGWDAGLEADLAATEDRAGLISHYPPPPGNDLCRTLIGKHLPASDLFGLVPGPPVEVGRKASPLCAFPLLYGPAEALLAVPPDPLIPFYGDEHSQGLRLWTRGYNFYPPREVRLYHLLRTSQERAEWKLRFAASRAGQRRALDLIGGKLLAPAAYIEGMLRSTAAWRAAVGLAVDSGH